MKKIISLLICLLLISSVSTLFAYAEESSTANKDNVTLSVKFDKSEYLVGEPMEMTVTLENNTDIAISYHNTNIERNAPFFVKFPYKEEGSYFLGTNELAGDEIVLPLEITEILQPKDNWGFIIDLNGKYVDPIDYKHKKPQAGEYSGTVYLTRSHFVGSEVYVSIFTDFTVNIVDELSADANTPKVFTVTKTLEDFGIADDEPTTVPTTQPLDLPDQPTQNAPTQSTELDVVHPTAPVPTQPTELDVVHPTATAPSGFYNNNPVPNPSTDAGSIPAISLALIGASVLIVCSKKKK